MPLVVVIDRATMFAIGAVGVDPGMATDPAPVDPAASSTDRNDDKPSLRQRLHAATGDRDAEAKALADRSSDEVSEADAMVAVQRAHGDAGVAAPATASEFASPDDATDATDDRDDRDDQ